MEITSPRDYDEIKEKVLLHDIKISDHDAKLSLLLRSRKTAPKSKDAYEEPATEV